MSDVRTKSPIERLPASAENEVDGSRPTGADHGEERSGDGAVPVTSPEEFYARLTERADVRVFLKRLADR